MRRHSARDAELHVFTYKEGLLSKVAHDLQITAQRFELTISDDLEIELTCEVRGLRVMHAMRGGKRATDLLSSKDKSKIEDTVCSKDVLDAATHPKIHFASTAVTAREDGYMVQGDLTICGHTKRIEADVAPHAGRLVTEVRLQQTDFGIAPFSALFGTLKVKPEVRVRVAVPEPEEVS